MITPSTDRLAPSFAYLSSNSVEALSADGKSPNLTQAGTYLSLRRSILAAIEVSLSILGGFVPNE